MKDKTTPNPTHRILYMEDNPGLARLFQRRLSRFGHQVDIAGNGEEGMAFIDQNQYDLVAVDQYMPYKDGLDVIREMSQREHMPPSIIVAAHGSEATAIEAMKLGAIDFIVKDMNGHYLDLLPNVIDKVLEKRQLKKERQQALRELKVRTHALAELNRIGQMLTATREIDQIFSQFLQEVADLVEADGSSIWLWDSKLAQRLVCYWVYSRGKHIPLTNITLEPGQGIAGWVAQNEKAVNLPFAPDDSRFASSIDRMFKFQTKSLLAVPLRVRNRVVGVLEIVNKQDGVFTKSDITLVETLAISGAIAIDNAGLIQTLNQQTFDLQTRNDDLDAFAHTVAHDLKSPVSTLMGFTDMLRYNYENYEPKDRELILDSLSHLGRKMKSIIEEILLLAELRKNEAPVTQIDMGQILAEAKARLAFMIQEYQAELKMPASWPPALGYASWVEEVWANYISNAVKYGGSPPKLELGYSEMPNNKIKFWVRDNGAGISEQEQAKLFVPFTSLQNVRIQGHGLGLSITRRIIEKLGGEVGVESSAGEGSVFSFTLPKA